MVNDEGIPRFFLAVSLMVLIPFINHLTFSREADASVPSTARREIFTRHNRSGVCSNTPRARC